MMDSAPPDGPLAFGDFLEHLRRKGFVIGVGEYLRLQQLLDRVGGDCGPSDLKTLLCPILATNKLQQEQVYNALDTFFDLFRTASSKTGSSGGVHDDIPIVSNKPEPTRSREWLYVLAGVLLLAAVLALLQVVLMRSTGVEHIVTEPTIPDVPTPLPENTNQGKLTNPPKPKPSPPPPNQQIEPPTTPENPKPRESFYRRYGNAIHLSAIFAPLILFIILEWRHLNRRKLILEKQRGKKPPFVWPLKVEAPASRLYDPLQLHNAGRLMRRRQVGEFNRLDVNATVAATIATHGYPSFRYRADSKPPEYLVLIDRASFRDHETRLFDELTRALEREGLFIDRYFYDSDPRACRNETGSSFHLVELREKYAEHRLLIFGDGEKLINPITGALEVWATALADWKQRALLTPEAPSRWGLREIILAEQFILLPATLEGLVAGVDNFELPRTTDLRVWLQSRVESPPADLDEPGVVDRLRRYLGEEIFQWLCACAVYPEIHWDLTLHLGSLACMPQRLVVEEKVSRLIRLPWFRIGVMPDNVRWLLIHELDRDKEKAIRAAIIELMERNPPPRETFAADAFQLNLVVQRWLSFSERKRRREMLQVLKLLPQSQAVRDYTVLRSLESARSPLDFILPRRLRRLFYRRSIPSFGLRTGARFLGALTVSAVALVLYFGLYFPGTLSTAHGSFFSNEDLLLRNIAVRPSNSSCLRCHSATVSLQNNCISCHTTGDGQTQPARDNRGFQPAILDAHARERIGCTNCHIEHRGQNPEAALVSYSLCANCHNDSYRITSGERAGTILGVQHGGTVGYPVVNGKWEFKLTADQIKLRGYPDGWPSVSSNEQFHSVHQMGRVAGLMSCKTCHTKGVSGSEDFRTSTRVVCALCHAVIGDMQTEQKKCDDCHREHGQSQRWAVNAKETNQLPVIKFTSPANGFMTKNSSVSVTGSIGNTRGQTVTLTVNGLPVTLAVKDGLFVANVELGIGDNHIRASQGDVVSNEVVISRVSGDEFIRIISPQSGPTKDSVVTVVGQFASAAGGNAIRLTVNGSANIVAGTNNRFAAPVKLALGDNRIRASQGDVVSNEVVISRVSGDEFIRIISPQSGATREPAVTVVGQFASAARNTITLTVNGSARIVLGTNNSFTAQVKLVPGDNRIQASVAGASAEIVVRLVTK